MGFSVSTSGDYNQTKAALQNMKDGVIGPNLDGWGELGVQALAAATPEDTGLTANSWAYRLTKDSYGPVIEWYNTHVDSQGTQIAILLQYGHGTGTGGYVQGKDYINPAIQEVFDTIVSEIGGKR